MTVYEFYEFVCAVAEARLRLSWPIAVGFRYYSAMPVPFLQYNILCSSLCEPSWYTASAPEDLDPPVRLQRVLAKLEEQIHANGGRLIIALQEVSMLWAGPLDEWFTARVRPPICSLAAHADVRR